MISPSPVLCNQDCVSTGAKEVERLCRTDDANALSQLVDIHVRCGVGDPLNARPHPNDALPTYDAPKHTSMIPDFSIIQNDRVLHTDTGPYLDVLADCDVRPNLHTRLDYPLLCVLASGME